MVNRDKEVLQWIVNYIKDRPLSDRNLDTVIYTILTHAEDALKEEE
jgi:hypothetical protein